jgi:hypothetical protein
MMEIPPATLLAQHRALSTSQRQAIGRAVAKAPHVDRALLEALMSRETNMRNITGDGGHGRGIVQADDRFQEAFLRSVKGCDSGTNDPKYRSAWPKGLVPTIAAGAIFATRTLEANVGECIREGVHDGDRLFVAVAGYNRGLHGAILAYKQGGGRAADAGTANGNYATDVLERAAYLRKHT